MALRDVVREIHRRSIWQVLAVYLVGAAVGYQLIEALVSGLGLPEWFPALAIILFVIGLPIVLATAIVQEGGLVSKRVDPTLLPEAGTGLGPEAGESIETRGARRLFTWRDAILGGLTAFALWGVVATAWLVSSDRGASADPGATEAEPGRKMLVVLPFENLGSSDQEYFADGITDEITSRLAAISELGVISRTSAVQYKNTEKGLPQIGEELGVDYVVEGTILWQQPAEGPSRIRVTPQLIRVADNTHVWADRYDAVLEDIFAVQTQIATQIIDALDVALLEPERRSIEAQPTENLEAYNYFLRGREYYSRSIQREDLQLGIQLLQNAIDLDPGFALAYANLSQANDYIYWFYDRSDERRAEIKRAAERALQLDPDLPDAHIAMGYYYYHGLLDYDQALNELAIAGRGRPSDADLWAVIGYIQRRQSNWNDAVTSLDRALQLDPRSTRIAWNHCFTYAFLKEYSKAESLCDRAISLAPDVADAYAAKAILRTFRYGGGARVSEVLQEASQHSDRAALIVTLASYFDFRNVFTTQEEYRRVLAGLELDAFGPDTATFFLSRTSVFGQSISPEAERAYYDSARAFLEARIPEWGGDVIRQARGHSALGLAYAGLGRADEAVREGEKAVELVPVSKSSFEGTRMAADLAQIYVMVGDYDAAIERLTYLVSIPSYTSKPLLRTDPLYDPLRELPRFQALLKDDS